MTTSGHPPYPVDEPDVSIGELVGRLTDDFGALVRDHVQLAKEEITDEVKQAGRGAGLIGGSALSGWTAVMLLSFALAWGLGELWDNVWLGFLVVGLLWAIVAGALFVYGRRELQDIEPVPQQTIDELEEDKRWLSEQKN